MRRQLLALAIALCAVPLVAGCSLLMPGLDEFDEGLGDALATYGTGRATLEIDGRTIVLDKLNAGPHLYDGLGANVYWYNEDGWGLRLTTYDDGGWMPSNDVTIDRVQTTYWSAPGWGDCVLEVAVADATGVRGSARCDGLRWTDQLRGGNGWGEGPGVVEGEPAFDAIIEFEAAPAEAAPAEPVPGSASPGPSAG